LNFQAGEPCSGNKQLFEIANGEKLFLNGIACFMGFSGIVETFFFRDNVKQVSNYKSRGYFESY